MKKSFVCVRQETYWLFFFFSNITYRFISHEMLKQFLRNPASRMSCVEVAHSRHCYFGFLPWLGQVWRKRQGERHGRRSGMAKVLCYFYIIEILYFIILSHIISYTCFFTTNHFLRLALSMESRANPWSHTFTGAVISLTDLIPSLESEHSTSKVWKDLRLLNLWYDLL